MCVNIFHLYAVQNCILNKDVPLVKLNCRYYSKNIASHKQGTDSFVNLCPAYVMR